MDRTGGLLKSLLKYVVERLGSYAVKEFAKIWKVEKEVDALLASYAEITGMLNNWEGGLGIDDSLLSKWLQMLEGHLYDAEDLVDYLTLISTTTDGTGEDKNPFRKSIFKYPSVEIWTTPHKLVALLKDLDEVRNFIKRASDPEQRNPEQLDQSALGRLLSKGLSFMHGTGRDKDKQSIIEELIKGQRSGVCIVGIDGLGKTSLAGAIMVDETIRNHFQVVLHATVSGDFRMPNIVQALAANCSDTSPHPPTEHLQNLLQGGKSLIILDDLWSVVPEHWQPFYRKYLEPYESRKILITSPNREVAERTNSVAHDLGIMSDEECKRLIVKSGKLRPSEPELLATHLDAVAKKCHGFPIVANKVGLELYGKKDIYAKMDRLVELENCNLHEMDEFREVYHSMNSMLLKMPLHLKRCFAYCALFPLHHEFNRDELIQFWEAEGFIQPRDQSLDSKMTAQDECFDAILSRSILHPSNSSDNEPPLYKMPAVMHWFAQTFASKAFCHVTSPQQPTNEQDQVPMNANQSPTLDEWMEAINVLQPTSSPVLMDRHDDSNEFESQEIRPASPSSSSEVIPAPDAEDHLNDYGDPSRPIQDHSVQSPSALKLLPSFLKKKLLPSFLEKKLLTSTEIRPALPSSSEVIPAPYDSNIDVQPTLSPVLMDRHDVDSNELESQGASSKDEALWNSALEYEKELEGKRLLFLFEKGFEFQKEMLIQLWMALGILENEPMELIGANYFEKLVDQGYISCCSGANSFYQVCVGKVKADLDMIAGKDDYLTLDSGSGNDVTSTDPLHVSIICDDIDEAVIKTLGRFKRLKALLFLRNYGSSLQEVPRDLLSSSYESIVALDLSGAHIKELSSSALKMIHLRFLDLSWTLIQFLPERIDRFKMLQTLKLKGCSRLHRLPKEIKGLTELRYLDLDVLGQLASFPKGIGTLVKLRTLSAFLVGIEEGLKISELKNLKNLTGEFCIAKLENVRSAKEAKEASLKTKRSIKKIELRWSDYQFQDLKHEGAKILKKLRPCTDLEEIQILCYPGTHFPKWIADLSFEKLVTITLFRCLHVSTLPSFEKLPALLSLKLICLNSVTSVNFKREVGNVAFPKLQKLVVDEMLNVESWADANKGGFPCLVELCMRDCPKLPKIPSLVYLPSIKHLEVSGCTKIDFVSNKPLSNSLLNLIVEDCPLIRKRCSNWNGRRIIKHVPTIWID